MKSLKVLMVTAFTILSVSIFAQDAVNHKAKASKPKSEKVEYSCPMHPDVTSNKPGKCPKCGMALVAKKVTSVAKKSYTCPMHPDVTSDKPGKCPQCGMALIVKKK